MESIFRKIFLPVLYPIYECYYAHKLGFRLLCFWSSAFPSGANIQTFSAKYFQAPREQYLFRDATARWRNKRGRTPTICLDETLCLSFSLSLSRRCGRWLIVSRRWNKRWSWNVLLVSTPPLCQQSLYASFYRLSITSLLFSRDARVDITVYLFYLRTTRIDIVDSNIPEELILSWYYWSYHVLLNKSNHNQARRSLVKININIFILLYFIMFHFTSVNFRYILWLVHNFSPKWLQKIFNRNSRKYI